MMELNNMAILETFWFNGGGIVLVQDQVTFEYKAYCKKLGRSESGPMPILPYDMTEVEKDIADIAAYGTKLPKEAIQGLFPGVILDETKSALEVNPGYFL